MKNMPTGPESESYERRGYSVRGLANWILDLADEQGYPVSNMALNKLVFFACERLLVERRALLTNAKIEAWEHGPVFREIYQSFKECADRPIRLRARFFSAATGTMELASVQLRQDDEAAITDAIVPLLSLSASRLRAISHVECGAWHRVWWHEGDANPGMEITPALLLEASSLEQPN